MIVIMRNHYEYTHINSICRKQGTTGETERSQSGSRRNYNIELENMIWTPKKLPI